MKAQKLFATCVRRVAATLPAMALAIEPRECVASHPMAASDTWDFQQEADGLLQALQNQATQVQRHAAALRSFTRADEVNRQAHTDQLQQIKAEINDMGQKLCRLTSIRRILQPWQQKEVDRIAPQVRLAADSAEGAINFLNSHEQTLWQPTYRRYIRNLDQEANRISNTAGNFMAYARTQ